MWRGVSRRGNPTLAAWEKRLLQEREEVVVTTKCDHCDWSTHGPMKQGKALYIAHRARKHPELGPLPQRRTRHRPYRTMVSETTLEDNIANARAQGAAGWAGPE